MTFWSRKDPRTLYVGIVMSMITWGVSWPSAKVLSRYGAPIDIAFIRFIGTFIGVGFLLRIIGIPLRISPKGFPSLLWASVLMSSYSLLFFTGILKGMPGAGGVLVTTMTPLVTFLFAVILSARKLSSQEMLGLFIGLVAAFFLLHLWEQFDKILNSGNLYFIGSTLVWAILSRHTSRSAQFGSPLSFSFWMYGLSILMLYVWVDNQNIIKILQSGDSLFWYNLLFNAVVNTGMATTFYFYATSRLGAEKTSSFIYIVPFAAAVSSLVLLGETILWNTIVGGLLGLAAVWMINRKKRI